MQKMKINALNSMSIDELWSLHEQIGYVLSSKMSEEKARLEKRLKQLTSAAPSRKTTRRPCPSVLPKFRNPVRPSELGLDGESSLAGFGLSCSMASS
jgi:DNA-binding protein H-NS